MNIKLKNIKVAKSFYKAVKICFAVLFIIFIILDFTYQYTSIPLPIHSNNDAKIWVKTRDKELFLLKNDEWEKFTVSGVIIEDTIPGKSEDKENVTYDMYLEWFSFIEEMKANTIQVRDLMSMDFYKAFYDFNTNNQNPLYLIQGITLKDEEYSKMIDAYSGKLPKLLKQKSYLTIDAIHGNNNNGSYYYKWNVSEWTLGYLLGTNWNPDLVLYTNDVGADRVGYEGKYITTWPTASSFETILAMLGDQIFSYETGKYGEQRLLAYSNWPHTDPLFHDTTWDVWPYENQGHVNVELLTTHDTVLSGILAAYQVEPNNPLFINHESAYSNYVDEDEKINPYKGYLEALNNYHRYPVIISGFGVPSSRGVSNIDEVRGFNQGGINEDDQGRALRELYQDILNAGCAGGCINTWNDSWNNTAWNTSVFVDADRSNYWNNAQSSTQSYGLLTYEPGKKNNICQIDEDVSEWKNQPSVIKKDGYQLQMMYDEKYLYFHVFVPDYQLEEDFIYIPIDITPNSGTIIDTTNNLTFDNPMDFLIIIHDQNNSKLLVHEYYNSVLAKYGPLMKNDNHYIEIPNKQSGKFDLVQQYLRPSFKNANGEQIPSLLHNAGNLKYGNSNPSSAQYDSLSDYMISENHIEIRIPWAMLNFSDPSKMMILDDYYQNYSFDSIPIEEIYAAMVIKNPTETIQLPSGRFELKGWEDSPTWHTRLKRSYYYVQDVFNEYSSN